MMNNKYKLEDSQAFIIIRLIIVELLVLVLVLVGGELVMVLPGLTCLVPSRLKKLRIMKHLPIQEGGR